MDPRNTYWEAQRTRARAQHARRPGPSESPLLAIRERSNRAYHLIFLVASCLDGRTLETSRGDPSGAGARGMACNIRLQPHGLGLEQSFPTLPDARSRARLRVRGWAKALAAWRMMQHPARRHVKGIRPSRACAPGEKGAGGRIRCRGFPPACPECLCGLCLRIPFCDSGHEAQQFRRRVCARSDIRDRLTSHDLRKARTT